MQTSYICTQCGEPVDRRRASLGYRLCLPCGEAEARVARKSWCVAPMHKSNYMLVTNRAELVGMNNKGGQVR